MPGELDELRGFAGLVGTLRAVPPHETFQVVIEDAQSLVRKYGKDKLGLRKDGWPA